MHATTLAARTCGLALSQTILDLPIKKIRAAEMGYTSDDVELGYGLRKPSWGKGYASEVAQALVRRAFTEMGTTSLVACVTIDNVASVRVLKKAGLRRAGEPLCLHGENELSVKYGLTKDEFDKREN